MTISNTHTSTPDATTAEAAVSEAASSTPGMPAAGAPGAFDSGLAQGPAAAQHQSRGAAFAITSFVLGIASIVSSWTFVAPIVGLVLGIIALRNKTSERLLALWGIWLNAAMLALTVLALIALALLAALGALANLPGLSV